MSLKEEVELLRKEPLFQKIEPAKLKLLAFTSHRLKYNAGDMLFKQGDPGDAAYLLLSGEAEVIVETPNGPLKVATIREHEIVGEIAILIDVPRTATIAAATDIVALKISKDLFFKLIEEFPQMAIEMCRELARRLEITTVQLREAHSADSQAG